MGKRVNGANELLPRFLYPSRILLLARTFVIGRQPFQESLFHVLGRFIGKCKHDERFQWQVGISML